MTLKPEIKKQWLEALRSGEYKQGRSQLHSVRYGVSNFCCLGVLCDLAVQEGAVEVVAEDESFFYDEEIALLPSSVMDWSGMETDDGSLPDNSRTLTELNDNGMPFAEIAEVIEELF